VSATSVKVWVSNKNKLTNISLLAIKKYIQMLKIVDEKTGVKKYIG